MHHQCTIRATTTAGWRSQPPSTGCRCVTLVRSLWLYCAHCELHPFTQSVIMDVLCCSSTCVGVLRISAARPTYSVVHLPLMLHWWAPDNRYRGRTGLGKPADIDVACQPFSPPTLPPRVFPRVSAGGGKTRLSRIDWLPLTQTEKNKVFSSPRRCLSKDSLRVVLHRSTVLPALKGWRSYWTLCI